MDKNHLEQNLPDKNPEQNPQRKTLRNIERDFAQRVFVRVFVLLKIGGPRCVTYFRGGSREVRQSVTGGRGSNLVKNSVTYFMDGPTSQFHQRGVCVVSF